MMVSAFFLITALWLLGQGHILNLPPTLDNTFASRNSPLKSTNRQVKIKKHFLGEDELISVSRLLQHPGDYHQKIIRLRGTVTRLELHLDSTNHFINFVFFLKDGEQTVLVFGRHDRTKGDIQLTSDRLVEVKGIFWKERFANGHLLKNNLEAQQVSFYPPLLPDQARRPQPEKNG